PTSGPAVGAAAPPRRAAAQGDHTAALPLPRGGGRRDGGRAGQQCRKDQPQGEIVQLEEGGMGGSDGRVHPPEGRPGGRGPLPAAGGGGAAAGRRSFVLPPLWGGVPFAGGLGEPARCPGRAPVPLSRKRGSTRLLLSGRTRCALRTGSRTAARTTCP